MRRARRADANQAEIVKAMRAAGASVEVLSDVGRGIADLLVGFQGRNHLIECKSEGGELTEHQVKWIDRWRGTVFVVESADEALRVIGAVAG